MTVKVTVDEAVKIADDYFSAGYTCSQSSLQGAQASLGFGDDNLWMAATGFGGGLGRTQNVCGALTGGVLALGMAIAQKRGSNREDRDGLRGETYAKTRELVKAFEAELGASDCRTLTGFDFSAPDGYQKFNESGRKGSVCHPAVGFVVRKVTELVNS